MAAVSHAMHRYAPVPLEPASTQHPYYLAATPQRNVYLASPELPGKSKKTWGQRLKLTKGDSSKSPTEGSVFGTVSGTSALSRSMKYAETWLYGTVRGSPISPQVNPFPEIAVLVCSCPEYINGTKRMVKKPSVCKKCKGSRLPIGGTMRAPAPSNMMGNGTIRSGTQRPVVKVRPTILNLHSPSDPYDFMRRSRLVSPEVKDVPPRNRAKSTSPSRGRTERRKSFERDRSRSASRTRDCFSATESVERRSILECSVNPYDLLDEDKSENDSLQNEVFDEVTGEMRYRKASTSDRNIRTRSLIETDRNIGLAKEKLELRNKKTKSTLDISKSYSVNRKSNEDTEAKKSLRITSESPTRPPRRSKIDSSDENESDRPSKFGDGLINGETLIVDRSQQVSPSSTSTNEQDLQQAIKSILKKPREIGDTDTSVSGSPIGGPQLASSQSPATVRASPVDGRKVSGSHFYLPTPLALSAKVSRKKVQFSVENETCPDVNVDASALETNPESTKEVNNDYPEVANEEQEEKPNQVVDSVISSPNLADSGSCDQDFTVSPEQDNISGSPPKASPLRRSLSDRQDRQTSGSPTITPIFLDTTALRIKNSRSDARGIFGSAGEVYEEESNRPRPVAAPPPPPSLSSSKIYDEISNTAAIEESVTNKPDLGSSVKNIVQKFHDDTAKPFLPPRQKFPFTRKMFEDLQTPSSTTQTKVESKADVIESEETITKTPRKQRTRSIKVDIGKKTNTNFVQISPNILNSSEVHRLQVTHESSEYNVYNVAQKKTSIMISGDDCYSTVNVSDDMPIYQSSVVVNDYQPGITNISGNTVTISVGSPRSPEEELTYTNNKKNHYLNAKSVIPVNSFTREVPAYASTPIIMSTPKSGSTLVNLDYGPASTIHSQVTFAEIQKQRKEQSQTTAKINETPITNTSAINNTNEEEHLVLRDPVEATRRNLVPHVCGKIEETDVIRRTRVEDQSQENTEPLGRSSFVSKLLEDPIFGHLAEGLENELVTKLIENSLIRLKENHDSKNSVGEDEHIAKLIDTTLQTFQEDRNCNGTENQEDDMNSLSSLNDSNRNSVSSTVYESLEYEGASDCYQSSASEMTTEDDNSNARNKFYQMLVDATLSEIEISSNNDDDHHYESIRLHADPIYEEIGEVPPPLPLSPPPSNIDDDIEKKYQSRSIFEGASKYDILSYLVDAKERGIVPEDSYAYNFNNSGDIIVEEQEDKSGNHQRSNSDLSSRVSQLSNASDSSEDITLNHVSSTLSGDKLQTNRKTCAEIERNDSGVGSETSKSSRSKWQSHNVIPGSVVDKYVPIHLCEDCDGAVETQVTESGVMFAPLVCRKCGKKRAERKEIITEIVETEEKYGRDLQIMLEEFYQPMLVAGLLTSEQLTAIFLNTEELLENNKELAERLRDSLEIAIEQGDEDLLTVDIGKIFVEAAPMLHAFESYCIRQGAASLLLANLEKDKELLRIFLRVSQMENTVLRRMNLNSFLMVPVQRVTKYPLLLARLYKVTPAHQEGREMLKQAQQKIELHLNHMNAEAKDIPTKLWRRISAPSNGARRSSSEIDMINIKLRKMAVDVLEWNHDEARFAMEGKLLFTQPTDNNWRKGRTIKLTHINALLVTNGKPSQNYRGDRLDTPPSTSPTSPSFPRHTGIREASLLLVKEKCGRYTLLREPLYLDRCVVCSEQDWDDYFEVQEIISKDTFIFKAEDGVRTKQWYTQLQYHAQGMGPWRKRRNALANIMINGMMTRT